MTKRLPIREQMMVAHALGMWHGYDLYGIEDAFPSVDAWIDFASDHHPAFDLVTGYEQPDHWTRFDAGQFSDDEAAEIAAMVRVLIATNDNAEIVRRYGDRGEGLLAAVRATATA